MIEKRFDENGGLYFEWTYLQFIADSIFLNIIFHETDMFGKNKIPYLSFSYLTIDGQKGHFRFDLSEKNDNFFTMIRNENMYHIYFKKGMLEIDGNFLCPSINDIVDEKLADYSTFLFSSWNVLIPRGMFSGKACLNGKIYATSAIVYQDKQWRQVGSEKPQLGLRPLCGFIYATFEARGISFVYLT